MLNVEPLCRKNDQGGVINVVFVQKYPNVFSETKEGSIFREANL